VSLTIIVVSQLFFASTVKLGYNGYNKVHLFVITVKIYVEKIHFPKNTEIYERYKRIFVITMIV
jgi:hypothetical protein